MLYTETYLKDDNYVRVGDLLRHILRKHTGRIKVMVNKKIIQRCTEAYPCLCGRSRNVIE